MNAPTTQNDREMVWTNFSQSLMKQGRAVSLHEGDQKSVQMEPGMIIGLSVETIDAW